MRLSTCQLHSCKPTTYDISCSVIYSKYAIYEKSDMRFYATSRCFSQQNGRVAGLQYFVFVWIPFGLLTFFQPSFNRNSQRNTIQLPFIQAFPTISMTHSNFLISSIYLIFIRDNGFIPLHLFFHAMLLSVYYSLYLCYDMLLFLN